MSKLNRYNKEKLVDDLKLIGKSIKIIMNENNQDNRQYAGGLALDLMDRLYRDIEEMSSPDPKGKTYGGTIRKAKKA